MASKNIDDTFFSSYRENMAEVKGIPRIEMNAPVGKQTTFKGTLGLELELEGARLPGDGYFEGIKARSGASWEVHADGSLRGGGREYVLSKPCNVEELPQLINGLWQVFKDVGAVVENSNRCSTHVHVNMNGRKVNELTSILALWTTFEEALVNWCGELRKANHFCLTSGETQSTVRAWTEFLTNGTRPQNGGLKYSALNILPLWTIGSFEFRCGAPADNPDIPITWAKFLHYFVEYCVRRFPNPMDIGYALSERGGEEIFKEICREAELKTFADEVLGKTGNFDRECLTGFRNAQPFVMGFPWNDWMPLINKEYVPNPFGAKKEAIKKYRLNERGRVEAVAVGLDEPAPPGNMVRRRFDDNMVLIDLDRNYWRTQMEHTGSMKGDRAPFNGRQIVYKGGTAGWQYTDALMEEDRYLLDIASYVSGACPY
jgi:hypothetical protein